jgi:leucyl aminopeptidase
MKFLQYKEDLEILNNNCIIFCIHEDEKFSSISKKLKKYTEDNLKKLFKINNWTGNFGKIILLHKSSKFLYNKVLLINCGMKKKFKRNFFLLIIEKIFFLIKNSNIKHVYIKMSNFKFYKNSIYWKMRDIINISKNIFYEFNKYKKNKKKNILKKVFIKINKKKDIVCFNNSVDHSLAISKGIKLTKDISNTPSNVCTPKYLVKKSKKIFKKYKKNINVQLINKKKIKKLGMNALFSVSKGSKNKPYISIINYYHKKSINKRPFILIGKGVTFDSGGISIKPSYLMDEMKYDMCGAAAIIGIMKFIAQLNLPLYVIGIIGTCENMPDGNSFKPGDIIKTMSQKTVEILNTDAEGRLVLCDILTYAERFNPKIVIDIATLTGSCVATLGDAASGLFSNNKKLEKKIKIATKNINDKVWSLPKFKIYKKYLKSKFADLSNVGGKYAGASTAAYFLSYFSKKYKWAHLDIAGTSWKNGKNKGATGQPVTLLCQYFLNFLKKNINKK